MTEPARPSARPSAGRGGKIGQALGKQLGPLPAWGWGLLVTGGAYAWYRHKQNAAGSATAGTTTPAASTPPFIIQNYPLGNPAAGNAATAGAAPAPEDESGKEPVKYVTKAGDTLETVARRFATDPGEILAATQEERSGFAAELMRLVSQHGMGAKLPAGRVLYYVPGSAPGGKKKAGTGPVRRINRTRTGK